ncbi:MAG: PorV/PorQ family protein [Elusimicrobiota bacterium]|jgi:hypothetical protein|nr:PorV/PorQ family protein [Elusimicrobiota bacterium]
MMKKIFKYTAILVLFIFSYQSFLIASSTDATSAYQHLKMDVGARTLAMGGAFVAVANDVNSIRYNPAGLKMVKNFEISATHMMWFANLNVEYLAFVKNLGTRRFRYLDVFGGSIFYMGSGDEIEGRDEQGNITNNLGYNQIAVTISGAKSIDLYDNVLVGANLKYASERFASNNYATVLADGGILYKWKQNINLGFSVRNLGISEDKLPLEFRAGSSYQKNKLGISMDIYRFIDTKLRVVFGGEYFINNILTLRAGYNSSLYDSGKLLDFESWSGISEYSISGLSLGFGFLTKPLDFFRGYEFKVDYAMVNFGRLGFTHIFTISFAL